MPSRIAPTLTVLVNGRADPGLIPITVQRSTGGRRMDYALLKIDPKAANARVQDFAIKAGEDETIEIIGELGHKTFRYFIGRVVSERFALEGRAESREIVARVDPWMFGNPLLYRIEWSPKSQNYVRTHLPTIFNEEVDGRIYGNRRTQKEVNRRGGKIPVFVDAEAIRTEAARHYIGQEQPGKTDPSLWKLSEAVAYLCNLLNDGEKFAANPSLDDIAAVVNDEVDIIRNLLVPEGLYLPQALDHIIAPFGYGWYLDIAPKKPTIRLYDRRTTTVHNELFLQPAGAALDVRKSNLAAANIEVDLGSIYNRIVARGAFLEIESTWTLQRGWDKKYDDVLKTQGYKLNRTLPDFDSNGYHDVGRKFVLNEAGDYTSLGRSELDVAFDFAGFLGIPPEACSPRRRRFLPCLTRSDDGSAPVGHCDGTLIEYYDKWQAKWRPIPGGASLLANECAVYFHSELVPEFIAHANSLDQIQIRITASIKFDTRVEADLKRLPKSPLGAESVLYLDLGNRFHWRYVDKNSTFSDAVRRGTRKAIEDDDRRDIDLYATEIRNAWDMAAINGPCTIEGIDDWNRAKPYKFGQVISGIQGRNVSFNAVAPGGALRWPQIVGITYHFQEQRTTLQLERFREPPKLLKEEAGGTSRGVRG